MTTPETPTIPSEILEAYYPGLTTAQEMIPGGEVNITFLVADGSGTKTILQRLSPIYNFTVAEDYEVVATHLDNRGWEMAEPRKTTDGDIFRPDDSGRLWRSFSYIEALPGQTLEGDLEASIALGGLLGDLHRSLATLDYWPKFDQSRNRDIHQYAQRLKLLLPSIPEPADRELATKMVALSSRDRIHDEPAQVIHGDPRIGNALFSESAEPFTFIDWDGFKRANPLVDVGDLLQSTAGEVLTKGVGSCSIAQLRPLLENYYETAKPNTDLSAFIEQALAAGRVIALDLGMRHLIDSVEDKYFVWDGSRFPSRHAFNIACAQRQWDVYKVLAA